ncbi:MAG: energy transducer TonB [Planctomycetes bacterium]|nr:energy transducer TonB [Planctomycetota bacterium]MCB9825143.1 energy transducer TonB [Planctomycetota bacterium]MCB9901965.1 energy transducer TonB [Planctomycetota bacterium]
MEGTVRIGLDIAASGAVQRAWVIVSSGDARLDDAARDLGLAVRFHPMSSAAIGELTVRFRLEG